jgi:Phosphoribosylformylglycinamidine (FGAM) synthase, synthetase domain
MVGLIEDLTHVTTSYFKDAGDSIILVETAHRDANLINLETNARLQRMVLTAIQDGLVKSAHDTSDGGLAIAIAECCYATAERSAIGASVKIPSNLEACKDLFGEYPSRILLTSKNPSEILKRAGDAGLRGTEIGAVGGKRLILNYEGSPLSIWRLANWKPSGDEPSQSCYPKVFSTGKEILLCVGSLESQIIPTRLV